MLAMILAVTLGQSPVEGVWVVATKRQGVAVTSANELVAAVEAHLSAFPRAALQGDLTSCKGKRPCLVAAAKKQHAAFLVTVEAARVVDQVIVKLSLLGIEEDGRTLAAKVLEGAAEKVLAELGAALDASVVPPLRKAFPAPEVAFTPPPPPPVAEKPLVVAPVEAPPAALVLPSTPPGLQLRRQGSSGVGVGTWLLGGATVLLGVGAGVFFGLSQAEATRLKTPTFSSWQELSASAAWGRSAQTLGWVFAGLTGAAAVGTVVSLLTGRPTEGVALWLTPQGAGVSVRGAFPW